VILVTIGENGQPNDAIPSEDPEFRSCEKVFRVTCVGLTLESQEMGMRGKARQRCPFCSGNEVVLSSTVAELASETSTA
jgi:hypothetical protein